MATIERNPDGSIKRIVLGIEDASLVDVLIDVERAIAARKLAKAAEQSEAAQSGISIASSG